jgi:hypothetical protein
MRMAAMTGMAACKRDDVGMHARYSANFSVRF